MMFALLFAMSLDFEYDYPHNATAPDITSDYQNELDIDGVIRAYYKEPNGFRNEPATCTNWEYINGVTFQRCYYLER